MSNRPFKINDRVMMIERGELYKGTIQSVYKTLNTAVVKFDNGEYTKVSFNRLAHDTETKEPEYNPYKEFEEAEITITGKEFQNAVMECATETAGGNRAVEFALVMFGANIHKKIFPKVGEND